MEAVSEGEGKKTRRRRVGVALCLSGGGFRAALFHLGALRRLNELGLLSRVGTISSVSGGSVIAAHLADRIRNWPQDGAVVPDWDATVAAPFREFVAHDLRTGPLLRSMLPWNWRTQGAAAEGLAAAYEARLTRLRLLDLPERPRFVFCATEMAFGINWVFERARVGAYMPGYRRPGADWTVARAVAASSCFPPVFEPLSTGLRWDELTGGDAPLADRRRAKLLLTDGGLYDNLGTEPVWKDCETLLVSDGGGPFEVGEKGSRLGRPLRYSALLDRQARSMRLQRLMTKYHTGVMGGACWRIDGRMKPKDGYAPTLVAETISRMRTDFDAFSEGERAVLENHGYLMADEAIARSAQKGRFDARHLNGAPRRAPHQDWMDEARVSRALAKSDRRRWTGRKR